MGDIAAGLGIIGGEQGRRYIAEDMQQQKAADRPTVSTQDLNVRPAVQQKQAEEAPATTQQPVAVQGAATQQPVAVQGAATPQAVDDTEKARQKQADWLAGQVKLLAENAAKNTPEGKFKAAQNLIGMKKAAYDLHTSGDTQGGIDMYNAIPGVQKVDGFNIAKTPNSTVVYGMAGGKPVYDPYSGQLQKIIETPSQQYTDKDDAEWVKGTKASTMESEDSRTATNANQDLLIGMAALRRRDPYASPAELAAAVKDATSYVDQKAVFDETKAVSKIPTRGRDVSEYQLPDIEEKRGNGIVNFGNGPIKVGGGSKFETVLKKLPIPTEDKEVILEAVKAPKIAQQEYDMVKEVLDSSSVFSLSDVQKILSKLSKKVAETKSVDDTAEVIAAKEKIYKDPLSGIAKGIAKAGEGIYSRFKQARHERGLDPIESYPDVTAKLTPAEIKAVKKLQSSINPQAQANARDYIRKNVGILKGK